MAYPKAFKKIMSLGLIVLIGFSISCSKDDEVKVPVKGVEEEVAEIDVNLDKDLILSIINSHRKTGATCGSSKMASVGNLAWSDELAKAALDHSNDMQVNGYFDHKSQDGRKFSERAKAAGFTGSPVGENIAAGYSSEESAMKGWMESSGHCKNIMNSRATHVGVARSDEGSKWTMVLGKQ